LREVQACSGLQKEGLERRGADISPGALVVDHVVGSQSDVAVQVRRCLIDRDVERLNDIATVDGSFPEQPKLDELELALDAPS